MPTMNLGNATIVIKDGEVRIEIANNTLDVPAEEIGECCNDYLIERAPAAPARVAPLTVDDFGPTGQKMMNKNPLWRAFRQDTLEGSVREALGEAVETGVSSTSDVFLSDAFEFFDRAANVGVIANHTSSVEATFLADHDGDTAWYNDTMDAQLVAGASGVVMAGRNGVIVPPVLLAIATDILKAHQRGYIVVALVGYRLFVARARG